MISWSLGKRWTVLFLVLVWSFHFYFLYIRRRVSWGKAEVSLIQIRIWQILFLAFLLLNKRRRFWYSRTWAPFLIIKNGYFRSFLLFVDFGSYFGHSFFRNLNTSAFFMLLKLFFHIFFNRSLTFYFIKFCWVISQFLLFLTSKCLFSCIFSERRISFIELVFYPNRKWFRTHSIIRIIIQHTGNNSSNFLWVLFFNFFNFCCYNRIKYIISFKIITFRWRF